MAVLAVYFSNKCRHLTAVFILCSAVLLAGVGGWSHEVWRPPCAISLGALESLSPEHELRFQQLREKFISETKKKIDKQKQYQLESKEMKIDILEETLPPGIVPDPTIRVLAEFANSLLQDSSKQFEFYLKFYEQVISVGIILNQRTAFISAASGVGALVARQMALSQGWGEILFVDKIKDEAAMFELLAEGRLFFDSEMTKWSHGGASHLLQWLLIGSYMDAKFGRGSAKKLLQYIGRTQNQKLWVFLCDRGPSYKRDSRGPIFYTNTSLVGGTSNYLGLP